ncbi:MAG: Ig-like domain-containing protein [Pirellulales bacterium]
MISVNWLTDMKNVARRNGHGRKAGRKLSILPLALEALEDRRLLDGEQIIDVTPDAQAAGASDPVSVDAIYSTANPEDETLTGLGLRLHFDSSELTFNNLTDLFTEDIAINPDTIDEEPDTEDFDGDPSTDMFIHVAWSDSAGNWPGNGTTPLLLYTANFTTSATFTGPTDINFSASSTATGRTFQSDSATITSTTPGSPPTADAGGPYTVDEGSDILLDASGSTDPDDDIVSFEWDLDNDGQFDDATGETTTFNSTDSDTFTVGLRVTDSEGSSDTDTALVTVNNVAPTAEAGGPYTTTRNVDITLSGSASSDPGDDIATFEWDLDNNGTFETAGENVVFDASSTGTFTVVLRVTDADGASDTDTAEVTVNPPNAEPTLDDITPNPLVIQEDAGQQIVVLTGISAGDGEEQTITVTAESDNPALIPDPTVIYTSPDTTGQLVFTPAANASGTATITVTVQDDGGTAGGGDDTIVKTFVVEVQAVNDPPVANDDAYAFQPGIPLIVPAPGVLENDSDVEEDPLTAELVTGPSAGILVLNTDGSFIYTPDAGFTGTDSFTYVANDGTVDSNVAVVTLTGQPLDLGDAPDPPYPTLLASDGAAHVITSLFLGATVDAELDGQPNATATGDGTDEDGVVFTNTLRPDRTANVTVVASEAGLLDAWIDFNADGDWNDAGEKVFSSFALSAGANFLTVDVPALADLGNTFARFRLSSSGGLSPTGLALSGEVEDYLVTIIEVTNEAPVANDDFFLTLNETDTVVVSAPGVLANDTDADGDDLEAQLVSGPTRGTLDLNADGSFTYTPGATFEGIDTFTYVATDGVDDSDPATVTIETREHSFVRNLYLDVLNRQAGEAEIQFWIGVLDNGGSREQIALGFLNSDEHLRNLVDSLYQHLLSRSAEPDGRDFWVSLIQSGVAEDEIVIGIAASDEYFNLHGSTNQTFVAGLYNDLLGRAPDASGLLFWESQMSAGASRGQVAASFVNSDEFHGLLVDDPSDRFGAFEGWYQDYLNRNADAGGRAFWVSVLRAGARWQQVQAALLASDEYFNT